MGALSSLTSHRIAPAVLPTPRRTVRTGFTLPRDPQPTRALAIAGSGQISVLIILGAGGLFEILVVQSAEETGWVTARGAGDPAAILSS
jgi:hypothetical protein